MRKNLVLVIMTIMVAMLFFIPSQGMAQQGFYMGGYLYGSVRTTNKVIVDVNFVGTNPGEIPSDKWLGGVASVAGGDGTSPTGWMHQNGVALFNDNDVIWAPQSWYAGGVGGLVLKYMLAKATMFLSI